MKQSSYDYDVAVIGGGPAGIAAAIAAGRTGSRTVLIEPSSILGGAGTGSLVGPWMTNYYQDEQVIRGVFQDVVDQLVAYEGSPGTVKCPYDQAGSTRGTGGHITPFDAEILKFVLNKLVIQSGVALLLNTYVEEVVSSDGVITGIHTRSKSLKQPIRARMYVDATGDGDIAVAAGARYEQGRGSDGLTQPVSALFKMSYVDIDQFIDYTLRHRSDFVFITYPVLPDGLPPHFAKRMVALSGFNELVEQGKRSGELNTGRERFTLFSDFRNGDVLFNATRLNRIDGTKRDDLIRAEIELREQVFSIVSFVRKYLPGFRLASLSSAASRVGVRETRRITGDYILNQDDVLNGAKFPDSIAKGCFPIDIHSPGDQTNVWTELKDAYDVPYRALCPAGLSNLLVAGRCISATHEALASVRVQSHCMATGQAAGVAAAIAASQDIANREVKYSELSSELLAQRAVV